MYRYRPKNMRTSFRGGANVLRGVFRGPLPPFKNEKIVPIFNVKKYAKI